MATSGAAAAKNDEDLKRKLWMLVRLITECEDGRLDIFDEAARELAELKNLTVGSPAVPQHFLCPLSSQLMRDPVIVTSGQTFDGPYIQEWLNSGNRTCPLTHQVLSHTLLTPNLVIRTMMSEWCIVNGIPFPEPLSQDEVAVPRKVRKELYDLLYKISSPSSISELKEALKGLRLLTGRNRSSRAVMGEKPDTIPLLLSVVCAPVPGLFYDAEFREDIVTTILNISIHDSNKKIIGDDPLGLPFLVDSLKSGTMETRRNAASALLVLSALDSMESKIASLGAIKPLVDLLKQENQTAKGHAGRALYNICSTHHNMARALEEGVVGEALKAITDESLVEVSLAILLRFIGYEEAMEEVRNSNRLPYLLCILRESTLEGCKEKAAVVLLFSCAKDRAKWMELWEEENS